MSNDTARLAEALWKSSSRSAPEWKHTPFLGGSVVSESREAVRRQIALYEAQCAKHAFWTGKGS